MNAASLPLRPASIVMSPQRAGAVVPDALSFSRAAMRELVRGRWRVRKDRFDLDDEGRGEILYRLVGGGRTFHFFLVSLKLDESQKTDRNFAQGWDAMGVLCEGDWTPRREARLRREVPKQRAGHADYDTLVYARGNRSARSFDAVVASLADGRQPDLAQLAPVGYILRTTAFIGNGQLGTRPFEGYDADHPLRRPYHAQFVSAFMLREYVFDLVDHLARVRSPRAVRLAPAYRRYLGLGNAAATGLVPFVVNHPHLMHRWCETHEATLARAAGRPAAPGDEATASFAALLDKAILHFEQSAKEGDGVFTPPQAVAAELVRVRELVAEYRARGTIAGARTLTPWLALQAWAATHVTSEAAGVVDALIVELCPDLVDDARDAFVADERFEVVPQASVADLAALVARDYGWALDGRYRESPARHFWYRARKTPRDVRRGLRGRDAGLEMETSMDTVLQVQRLADALRAAPAEASVAGLLAARPDLRHVVARVQSLAGLAYAELREHWLAGDFSPFAPVRFALSFYGMEKFEAAPPKSVRGTFMQGAPIAEDVAAGRDGSWPYPLVPSPDDRDGTVLEPLPPSIRAPRPVAPPDAPDDVLAIAPRELGRMVQNALQGHGAALGVAEDAAWLVVHAQMRGEPAVATLLQRCGPTSALVAAPAAADRAIALACRGASAGVARVEEVDDAWLVAALVLRLADHGLVGVCAWAGGAAIAAPATPRPWIVRTDRMPDAWPVWAHAVAAAGRDVPSRGFVVAAARAPSPPACQALLDALGAPGSAAWSGGELASREEDARRRGVRVLRSDYDALAAAGALVLVPEADEPRVLPAGADPLKVF